MLQLIYEDILGDIEASANEGIAINLPGMGDVIVHFSLHALLGDLAELRDVVGTQKNACPFCIRTDDSSKWTSLNSAQ